MSLINQALKQASQIQPAAPQHLPPRAVGVMHHARQEDRRPKWVTLVVLPFALTVVLLLAALFLREWWISGQQDRTAQAEPVKAVAARAEAPAAVSTPAPVTPSAAPIATATTTPVPKPEPVASKAEGSASEVAAAPTAVAAPTVAATPAATEAPAPAVKTSPSFKLQGITYSAASPSALINGTSVFVGDEVNGAVVAKIDRQAVTLQLDGETKVLKMR